MNIRFNKNLTSIYKRPSTTVFVKMFAVFNDPQEVIIDFGESKIADMSTIDAVNKIAERYEKVGKKFHLLHLSADSRQLIKMQKK